MDVDGVFNQVRPHGRWRIGVASDGARKLGDDPDGSLGDRVEIVIVRWAHG